VQLKGGGGGGPLGGAFLKVGVGGGVKKHFPKRKSRFGYSVHRYLKVTLPSDCGKFWKNDRCGGHEVIYCTRS